MPENFFHDRNLYEKHLRPWVDKPVIKVITGMRRVGKSCLLRQLIAYLRSQKVPLERIHLIDKESIEFDEIVTYRDLVAFLRRRVNVGKGKQYLLIDEVQEIEQWEKAVNSYLKEGLTT